MRDYQPQGILTANPGDRIAKEEQSIEEKAKQMALDTHDFTGVPLKVPTYFVVKYPDGKTEALHHIRDAQKISDVVRQITFDEGDNPIHEEKVGRSYNLNGLLPIISFLSLLLLLFTAIVAIGIF